VVKKGFRAWVVFRKEQCETRRQEEAARRKRLEELFVASKREWVRNASRSWKLRKDMALKLASHAVGGMNPKTFRLIDRLANKWRQKARRRRRDTPGFSNLMSRLASYASSPVPALASLKDQRETGNFEGRLSDTNEKENKRVGVLNHQLRAQLRTEEELQQLDKLVGHKVIEKEGPRRKPRCFPFESQDLKLSCVIDKTSGDATSEVSCDSDTSSRDTTTSKISKKEEIDEKLKAVIKVCLQRVKSFQEQQRRLESERKQLKTLRASNAENDEEITRRMQLLDIRVAAWRKALPQMRKIATLAARTMAKLQI